MEVLLLVPGFLIGITIHEFSHGYAAYRLGDPTARNQGRLTLNPFAHIDPVGTIIVPAILILSRSPFLFGWARPVPVDPRWFRDIRKSMMWSALAGPLANFATAAVIGIVLNIFFRIVLTRPVGQFELLSYVIQMLYYTFQINVVLGAFNLIPIPPLDGSKVLSGVLPVELAVRYERIHSYGPVILLGLIIFGNIAGISVIGLFISPFLNLFHQLFLHNVIPG
jgi:Zn-dependent protease